MNESENKTPKKVYISYVDEDLELFKAFQKHLSLLQKNKLININSKQQTLGSKAANKKNRSKLAKEADMIIFLVSIEMVTDPDIENIELKIALKKHEALADKIDIVPVLVRRCFWQITPISKFKKNALPPNQIPISLWDDKDAALSEVVEAIYALIKNK